MINDKKVSALVCEFNPLHNGHKYILDKMREGSDYVLCVMSGNFVQRGDLAIIDKWKRTKCALLSGADLVIELPVWNAVSTAEKFAYAGVNLIDAVNCADDIYFGSECGDIEKLKKCAEIAVNSDVSKKIQEYKNSGESFAAIREKVVNELYGDELSFVFKESNNILGIEYIKALNKLESKVKPNTVKRYMAGHNEGIVENFASATKIRELIESDIDASLYMPELMANEIKKNDLADIKNLERAMIAKIRSTKPEMLLNIPDVAEGLHNKIIDAANNSVTLEELYLNIKSKRYSHARIRRIILSAFLGITSELPEEPLYIRVLGMNKKGEELLKERTNTLPYVLSYSDSKKQGVEKYFEFEAMCDSIYAMALNEPDIGNSYYKHPIIKI